MGRHTKTLVLDVIIDAPQEVVFEAMVDWDSQGEWMLGTVVRTTSADGRGVGATFEAVTGVNGRGVLDTMTITRWEPPHRVDVVHTGKVVRGTGTFEVLALPWGRSRFVWREDLELPLGALGRAGWVVAKWPFKAGVEHSLKKFAALVEARHAGA